LGQAIFRDFRTKRDSGPEAGRKFDIRSSGVRVVQIYHALVKLLGKGGRHKGLHCSIPTDNDNFIIVIHKNRSLGVVLGSKPCLGQFLILQFQHLRTHIQEHADLGSL
jgi:hypothetical protein